MKIRQDFITNSSSTSFIISLKDDWNEKSFYKSIGVLDDTALRGIFVDLYNAIDHNKEEITTYIKKYYPDKKTVESFLSSFNYSKDVIEKVSQLRLYGKCVFGGREESGCSNQK